MNKPFTIVVVDDDQSVTRLMRSNLEGKDIRVLVADCGMDCLSFVRDGGVDMVLLDLKLPDFNGWGILGLLRLTESLRNIKVVMASAEPPNRRLMEFLKPDGYIQKPFDIRDFVARVMDLVSLRQAQVPEAS